MNLELNQEIIPHKLKVVKIKQKNDVPNNFLHIPATLNRSSLDKNQESPAGLTPDFKHVFFVADNKSPKSSVVDRK